MLQSEEDKTHFILYEAFRSKDAAKAHKETAHYLKWREVVSNWMKKPRESHAYNFITPTNIQKI